MAASAYRRTTSSVPLGRTKARPEGTRAAAASMASCSGAGDTTRVSSGVVTTALRSGTAILDCRDGRSAYTPSHSTTLHPFSASTASTNRASDSASPMAWLISCAAASRRRRAAAAGGDRPSVAIPRSAAKKSGWNSTVPWPLASKYTPTSYAVAAWCTYFTPVLAITTGRCSVPATYAVDAPLAYAVCTMPTDTVPGAGAGAGAAWW